MGDGQVQQETWRPLRTFTTRMAQTSVMWDNPIPPFLPGARVRSASWCDFNSQLYP